ncbi:amino acid permease [Candidatus Uabimicrobium sp. HlEnr_7]|uniref:amino acid permease n=1 Tax=Candidatus Uabimicrobium helgolandensis TaxID=3095367 RepID=UPI003558AAFB
MDIGSLRNILETKKKQATFARTMGLFSSTVLGMGTIMGAGIYILVGLAAEQAGSAVWISYLICGALAYLSVLMYADLGCMITTSGGGYIYAYQSLGPFWGFITGWHLAIGSIFACAIYALGFAIYSVSLFSHEQIIWLYQGIAIVLTWGLTLMSVRGTQGKNAMQQILTLGNVLILLIIASIAFTKADPQGLSPILGNGTAGIFSAIGVIYLSFFGYQLIANNSEEVVDPEKTVPLAMKLSLTISAAIYLIVVFAALLVVPAQDLAQNPAPLALVAEKSSGTVGLWLVIFGGLLASGAALSSTLSSQSRQIYAMGRDRLFGKAISRLEQGIPKVAFVVASIVVSLVIFFLQMEIIVRIANFCFLVSMLPLSFALSKLHQDKISQGEHITFTRRAVPWVALIANVYLLISVGKETLITGSQIGVIGIVVFLLYSRSNEFRGKTGQSFALVEDEPVLSFGNQRILVPMANPQTQKALLTISEILLCHYEEKGEIVALCVSETQQNKNFIQAIDHSSENALNILSSGAKYLEHKEIKFRPVVRVSRSLPLGVVHGAHDEKCSLIVMGFHRDPTKSLSVIDEVLSNTKVSAIFLKNHAEPFAPRRIAVALGGKIDNLSLMVELASSLGDRFGSEICFLSILPVAYSQKQRKLADKILIKAIQKNTSRSIYRAEMIISDDPFTTLISKSENFDLLIAGATKSSLTQKPTFGDFSIALAQRSKCSVALAYKVASAKKWINS